jgi:hypothetical protein
VNSNQIDKEIESSINKVARMNRRRTEDRAKDAGVWTNVAQTEAIKLCSKLICEQLTMTKELSLRTLPGNGRMRNRWTWNDQTVKVDKRRDK